MPKKDTATPATAETITPLSARLRKDSGAGADDFKRHFRYKAIALVGSLVFLVIAGVWLLSYLSKKSPQTQEVSVSQPPQKEKAEEKAVTLPEAPPAKAIEATQLAFDF